MERLFAVVTQRLAANYILPEHYWTQAGDAGFNLRPEGVGPHRSDKWERANFIALRVHHDYWGLLSSVPGILFRYMPEGATRTALEALEVDVAYAVPVEVLDRLKGRAFRVVTGNTGQNFTVNYSALPGSPVADKRVWQTMNLAVDKSAIIGTVMGGFARWLEAQIVGPHSFGHSRKLEAYPYDPSEAKRPLAAAGYPQSFEIAFIGNHSRYPKDKEIAERVASYPAAVGIRAKLEVLESGVWLSKLYQRVALGLMRVTGRIANVGVHPRVKGVKMRPDWSFDSSDVTLSPN